MTPVRRQRTKTARYIAEKMGICERSVRNYVAEERSTYTGRAADRRRIAGEMRAAGASWEEIAAAVDGTPWAARGLVRRYATLKQGTEQSPPAANAAALSKAG